MIESPGQGAGGGDKDVSIGLIIDAAISFIAVAFFLFLVVKAYNRWRPPAEAAATGRDPAADGDPGPPGRAAAVTW